MVARNVEDIVEDGTCPSADQDHSKSSPKTLPVQDLTQRCVESVHGVVEEVQHAQPFN